jgi:hypothetical protein
MHAKLLNRQFTGHREPALTRYTIVDGWMDGCMNGWMVFSQE